MKILKQICAMLLVLGMAWAVLAAEPVRTDVNPALLYYQAYLLAPQVSEADLDYLGTNYWGKQALPKRYGELVSQYDEQFSLVREAARSPAPCIWGNDKSIWPLTPMPQLARAKAVAVATKSRVVWELSQGQQTNACEDWLATVALARNIATEGTLISALVQIAMESMATWNFAEHFGRFSPESLEQIAAGLKGVPARGTIVAALTNEADLSRGWLVGTIEDLRSKYPGDDAKVMAELRNEFRSLRSKEQGGNDPWEKFIRAGGGTSESMLNLVRDAEPHFQKLMSAFNLPWPEFQAQEQALQAEAQNSSNPLMASFAAIIKARRREERGMVTVAMVQAAIEYKLHGMAAMQAVRDPSGTGPFGFRRFVFEGVDRGFQLTSALDAGGFTETLVFVELPGPAFLVGGPHVGTARGK